MPRPLPQPTRDLLVALADVGRFLDRVAERAPTVDGARVALGHGITIACAIKRIEDLAELVDDYAADVQRAIDQRQQLTTEKG